MFGNRLREEGEREGEKRSRMKDSLGRVIKGHRILLPQFWVVF